MKERQLASEAMTIVNVLHARLDNMHLDLDDWLTIKQQVQMLLAVTRNAINELGLK